ncbi:MAG: hypothetical protein M3Z75_06125, partial [Actinomycetota bacterium]|nr:hypothetical protein [Actinomycetota bacterium]
MTAFGGNRTGKRLLRALGAATLAAGFLGGFLAGPVKASTGADAGRPSPAAGRPSAATGSPSATASSGALVRAYLSARHLPAGAVAGIRAGSLHQASVAGATWAIADFTPSASAAPGVQAGFQDGAGTGIFRQAPGQPWRLVQTGPYGCGRGLPAGLSQAWGLPAPV